MIYISYNLVIKIYAFSMLSMEDLAFPLSWHIIHRFIHS